jgi:hypothetical protein
MYSLCFVARECQFLMEAELVCGYDAFLKLFCERMRALSAEVPCPGRKTELGDQDKHMFGSYVLVCRVYVIRTG